jgi:lambda family phage portal protein
LRGGIEFDDHGGPLAYHVRNAHPADYFRFAQSLQWERIPRATAWGRPVFIHGFEPEREDQSRAITPFAALMSRLRMIGKFADTELAAATVNALFAAFVASNLPADQVAQSLSPASMTTAFDNRINYYRDNPAFLNGVRIPVLPPGDKIEMNAAPRHSVSFHQFQTAFLQSIASGLGISYEQLSMDWSKVNYSSARAALNEVWRHVQALFASFVEQVVTPVYFAFAEEAFDRGYIVPPKGAPDFYDMPAAYLGARWIGPGRGYVDAVKEAQGSSMRMAALTSTLEKECADMGLDFEDTADQIAFEEKYLAARNLKRAVSAPGASAVASSDERPSEPEKVAP